MTDVRQHYDMLIDEGNDPVLDSPELKAYMDRWDGQLFIDLLDIKGDESVLEIGCGTGRIAIKVAPKVRAFCGIDISQKSIDRAQYHLTEYLPMLVCDDFLTHGFEQRFDLIYSTLTFMHIKDKRTAIEKIRNLLCANGRLVISIDKSQSNALDYGTRKIQIYPDCPHQLSNILDEAGFKEIKIQQTDFAYILQAHI